MFLNGGLIQPEMVEIRDDVDPATSVTEESRKGILKGEIARRDIYVVRRLPCKFTQKAVLSADEDSRGEKRPQRPAG